MSKELVYCLLGTLVYLSLLVCGAIGRDHGLPVALQLKHECGELKRDMVALQDQNRQLQNERQRLQTDRRYQERLIREELKMVGEREWIFSFSNPQLDKR